MINTSKLRKQHRQRRLEKLARIADRIPDDSLDQSARDKQDAMLAGLDDGWDFIREKIIDLAGERGEWAGYPLPIEHAELVIEPRHPLADTLNGFSLKQKDPADLVGEVVAEHADLHLVNRWFDKRRSRDVYVYREGDNPKSKVATLPKAASSSRLKMTMDLVGASQAWSVEAEFTAIARLKTLVTRAAFRYYLLTGTFLESSPRSGVMYLFRKCRPTLAMKACASRDDTRFLAALCLHPIGYYAGTFAGSMVPTDDVIAHLLFMRGDERKFWSKCNQHELSAPEAGV